MKGLLLGVILATALCSAAESRITRLWTYEELRQKSDLIVIGRPIEVRKLSEEFELPDISSVKALGVETVFDVLAVMKGAADQRIVLHHYRQDKNQLQINGPLLIEFDPKGCERALMFLKRRADGQYEGVAGQTDLVYSVKNLGCM